MVSKSYSTFVRKSPWGGMLTPAAQRSFCSIILRKPSIESLPRPTSRSVPVTERTILRRKRLLRMVKTNSSPTLFQ